MGRVVLQDHSHLLCEQNLLIVKVTAMEAVYLLVEVVAFPVLFLLVLYPLPLAVVAVPHVVLAELLAEPVPGPHVVLSEPLPVPHVVLPEPVPVHHVLFAETSSVPWRALLI